MPTKPPAAASHAAAAVSSPAPAPLSLQCDGANPPLPPCQTATTFAETQVMAASTTTTSRPMESRTGRMKQRYNANGERLVAGVVPLTENKQLVLLIQSDQRKGWVLPKGGWENDEDCQAAARREAWEEAGILIQIEDDLGDIVETRPPKAPTKNKKRERALYRFYEATVTSEENEWPEKSKRERRWMTYTDAHEALKDRPELREALNRSNIVKR